MKVGGFPGREDALRQRLASLERDANARASRRMFLGLAVGGALGACAGGAAVSAVRQDESAKGPTRTAVEEPPNPRLEWARKLATGPLDKLLAAQGTFIIEARAVVSPEDVVWLGVARIASAVVEQDRRAKPGIREAILVMAKHHSHLPPYMDHWMALLRSSRR